MRRPSLRSTCSVLLLLAISGCGKVGGLNEERNWAMESQGYQHIIVEAPKRDQQIKITMNSGNVSVSMYVVKESDVDPLEKELANGKPIQTPTLDKREKVRDVTLSTKIPAGTGFGVVVSNVGNSNTTVKLKVVEE